MFTMDAKSTRMAVSAFAAVAVVSFGALALDQGHLAGAPRGTVEVGELTLVNESAIAAVTLPEVTVVAQREAPAETLLASTQLPEIVVVAKRVVTMVARNDAVEQTQLRPEGSAAGALLK